MQIPCFIGNKRDPFESMTRSPDTPHDESARARLVRRPSGRWAAALAAAMLGAGIAVGAAIGPAPAASLAGDAGGLARQLPLLIARIEAGRSASSASTATIPTKPPPEPTPAASKINAARPATTTTTPAAEEEETSKTPKSTGKTTTKKLPAVTSVWTIQLSGPSFADAIAAPSAAPFIDTQLLPAATLLSDWSAIDADAFSSEALLAEPPAAGAVPPQLHSIVQPPCPEGAAGAACAPETPGQLTAADEFLKATLATITATSTFKEHGLVVITFTTVGIAAQSELPAGASTSTLSYQPPAGVALLSPFTRPGARSTAAFNPTSPRRSLEKLLH
jgi:hypothetical protein